MPALNALAGTALLFAAPHAEASKPAGDFVKAHELMDKANAVFDGDWCRRDIKKELAEARKK